MTQPTISTAEYVDYGRLNIRIDRHWDGTSIVVTYHDGLNRAFPNHAEADAYLALLEKLEAEGHSVYVIEQQAGMWTTAAAAANDAEAALVDDINRTIDTAAPATVDVSDILADIAAITPDQDWRHQTRKQIAEAAGSTARIADHTRSRVGSKELTQAELDLIRSHRDGTVTTKRGQSWTILRAIVRRGYGTPVYGTGRRIIAVTLNQRGLNAAQSGSERAA